MDPTHLLRLENIEGKWNHPRSPVPKPLAALGVAEATWNKVYDEATAACASYDDALLHDLKPRRRPSGMLETVRYWWKMMDQSYGPKSFSVVSSWERSVDDRTLAFRGHGIDVFPSLRNRYSTDVQLHFPGILDFYKRVDGGPAPQPKGSTSESTTNNSFVGSLAHQLESLFALHKSGALTDEEYAAAKAKVINQPDNATAIVVAEIVPQN